MGGTYCDRFIRVVSCMPVSWGAERDERDVLHDERFEDLVVGLRLWRMFETWMYDGWVGDRTSETARQKPLGQPYRP